MTITPAIAPASAAASAPTVRTAEGPVRGQQLTDLEVYRSIPYAAPPTGDRRFLPPVPHSPWKQTRDARQPGPACMQTDEYDPTENNLDARSEDCLSLNVWTPKSGSGTRPVLVFIHGGAFGWGSTRNTFLDGSALARRGDAVVVTIQYRLGAFGFTELSNLDKRFSGGGNAGLLDQVEALRWVKRNIGAFGGDASNVTISGESAGAESVRILLGTPAARGLFHKAIIQSGINNLMDPTPSNAHHMTRKLMKAVNATTITDLQQVGARTLAEKGEAAGVFSYPHVDGYAYPTAPNSMAPVPLMIGTNLDEMRYWTAMCAAPGDESVTTPALIKNVFGDNNTLRDYFGDRADDVVASYQRDYPSQEEAVVTFLGDGDFRASSIRLAEQQARQAPTYMYLFGYRSPVKGRTGKPYGAAHSMELPFLFGTLDKPEVRAVTGPDAPQDLADHTMDAWLAFARSGNPTTAQLPWPSYSTLTRSTMLLDHTSQVVNDPYAEQRKAWERVPFTHFPYPLPFAA
ncbi:carboxylesterase/lipase family protein [Streptomyces sp. NPDC097727]|uniref:carboxylesterase/lipase family protein n=1 Tax=Streptomyces sp. NPDC097727 TaxID=3366092 RepID=UPI00380EF34D